MDALSKTGFLLYIPLLSSGTMEIGGGVAKLEMLSIRYDLPGAREYVKFWRERTDNLDLG